MCKSIFDLIQMVDNLPSDKREIIVTGIKLSYFQEEDVFYLMNPDVSLIETQNYLSSKLISKLISKRKADNKW